MMFLAKLDSYRGSERIVRYTFLIFFLLFTFGQSTTLFAHELLPKEVVEYIKEHPDATPEDMRAFALTQDLKIAEKFANSSTEEILRIIKNPESGFFDNAYDFAKLGMHHILIGADHILFVFTLLLVFVSAWEILKLATTFTVAHSVTLILAGTGIVVLSPAIVEPLIALSIAVMAISTVFFRESRIFKSKWSKVIIVFIFGLFHGLGFAGLLEEIAIPERAFASSLLAFNIGIEIGQLVIIGLALPVILYFRNKTWYPTAIKIFALSISVIAIIWFVERSIAAF